VFLNAKSGCASVHLKHRDGQYEKCCALAVPAPLMTDRCPLIQRRGGTAVLAGAPPSRPPIQHFAFIASRPVVLNVACLTRKAEDVRKTNVHSPTFSFLSVVKAMATTTSPCIRPTPWRRCAPPSETPRRRRPPSCPTSLRPRCCPGTTP
jgi:hypothetical protein